MSDTRRQDLVGLRRGEPYLAIIDLDGDQSGATITLEAAPRWQEGDAPVLSVGLTVGVYDPASGTTPATLSIPVNGENSLATLTPGVVYVYKVGPQGAPSAAWGELHVAPEWS